MDLYGIEETTKIIIKGRAQTHKDHATRWRHWSSSQPSLAECLPADPTRWMHFMMKLHISLDDDNTSTLEKMQTTCNVVHTMNGFEPPECDGINAVISAGIRKARRGPTRRMKPLTPGMMQRIWSNWGQSDDVVKASMAFYILYTFVLTGRYSCMAAVVAGPTIESARAALGDARRTWQTHYGEHGRKTTPWASNTCMGFKGALTERFICFTEAMNISDGPLLRGLTRDAGGNGNVTANAMEYSEYRRRFRECLIDCCPETEAEMPLVGKRAYGTHSQRRGSANAGARAFPEKVARLHGDWKTWDSFMIYLEEDDEEVTSLVNFLTADD